MNAELETAVLHSLNQLTPAEAKTIADRQEEIMESGGPKPVETIHDIQITELRESATNPRKRFDGLDELAGSILRQGLLQPLVVRPIDGPVDSPRYEIVIGHRRYRAAKLAKLTEVRCDVRALTDREAAEAQLVENVQRADLSPLEEAEGYAALVADHGYTADTIAACAKKSKAWVYSRLKLLALGPEARKALDDGTLPASVAIPLARVPSHELQAKALKSIKERTRDGDGRNINARDAIDYVQREFARQLKDAPFDLKDADLLPVAGACATCPKNARNLAVGLFDDLGKKPGDVCTDTKCYAEKCKAAFVVTATDLAAKKGARIATPEESKQLFGEHGTYLQGTGSVDLGERCWEDKESRTWGQLYNRLPEDKRPQMVVMADGSGKARQVVDRKELVDALALHGGAKFAKAEAGLKDAAKKSREESKAAKSEAALRESVLIEVARRLGAEAKKTGLGEVEARYVALGLAASVPHSRALSDALGIDDFKKLEKEIADSSRAELNALTAVLLAFASQDDVGGEYSDELQALAKGRRIDLDKLEAVQKTTLEAEAAKKTEAKEAKPTKAPKKK